MRAARRKQRHQSEPLPARACNESPEPQDPAADATAPAPSLDASSGAHPSPRFSVDPQVKDGPGMGVAFPLTPTSAAGEAERAMATATTTTTECSRSDEHTSPDKMSQHTSINDASAHPPVNDPSPANTARAPPPSYANGSSSSSSSARTMSHLPIRPRYPQDTHSAHYYSAHPSPPPITTLTHSPSLSSDRSSVSSPAPTILPPLTHQSQLQQSQAYLSSSVHRYPAAPQPGAYHHSHYYPSTVAPPDVFAAPAQQYAHTYAGGYAPPPPTHVPFHHAADMSLSPSQQYSGSPYANVGSLYSHGGHGGGGSGGYTPIYTDDASTKLSDRVRRRCFNCCTTDTSTWRRSSLNPGKVLCNKCGLFERTHSRPRPDQFPHKRAPLQMPSHSPAHDTVQSGPTQAQSQGQSQSQSQSQNQAQSPHIPALAAPHNLPPTTAHPSLGAAYNHPSALPQIQEWLRPNTNTGPGGGGGGGSSASSSSSAGPSRASSAADRHRAGASSMQAPGSAPEPGTSGANAGAGSGPGDTRSPAQTYGTRLVKRSESVNSEMLGMAPSSPAPRQAQQNLTPSPSPPPPDGTRGGSSPRAPPHGAGKDTGKP